MVNLSVICQSVIFQFCKFRSVYVSPSFFVRFVPSVIFQSVNFHPCDFVRHLPVLHYPLLQIHSCKFGWSPNVCIYSYVCIYIFTRDLDPITFIHKLDLAILNVPTYQNEASWSSLSKVTARTGQTDRQTRPNERITSRCQRLKRRQRATLHHARVTHQ